MYMSPHASYPYEWSGQPVSMNNLLVLCEHYRRQGQVIVTTNGCFDLLHNGHLHLLEGAHNLGDILIVALNSDSSVRSLKGNLRPIVREFDRAAMVKSIRYVDHVVVFDGLLPTKVLAL